ncbi:baseplate hub protein [Commensalibacter communis]|uniref:baseplate hub protein n=1 Tax=Commensalibacter communis TaxID=2972786 RepID=UPI0022FF58B6|nr:hypothetical protein [Commensalibacter communis]CAI3933316.1 unnamed protein product [Commensalibacter communis]CAI3944876.1 unnamed protein product [Commensalibacter communis]
MDVIGVKPLGNTFIPRILKYRFIGGKNQNGDPVFVSQDKDNARVIAGLRSEVTITKSGARSMDQAVITIYNLPLDLAKTISTVGFYGREALSWAVQVEIYASLDNSTEEKPVFAKIFSGGIMVCYADFNQQPTPSVRIEAQTLGGSNLLPAESISFKGQIPAIDIVNTMVSNFQNKNGFVVTGDGTDASKFGFITKVINENVTATITNPNYHGDFWTQLQTLAKDADFEFIISNDILYIFPTDADLSFSPMRFTPASGMIGYPTYSSRGIIIRSLFKPSIKYGQSIDVYVTPTKDTKEIAEIFNGKWNYMVSLSHDLSCNMPNGPWFTTIEVAKQNIRGSLNDGSE